MKVHYVHCHDRQMCSLQNSEFSALLGKQNKIKKRQNKQLKTVKKKKINNNKGSTTKH